MIEVPLAKTPNQEFEIELEGQACTITVRQLNDYVYLSSWLDSTLIVENAICMPLELILQGSKAHQFNGNFLFYDVTAPQDLQDNPDYEEFSDRFKLLYLTDSEIEALKDADD
jgi:hypothetical protein